MIRLYAEPVPSDEICDGREYYLPHHSVVHPTKGKTRVVFDCASKSRGVCLNDLVLPGPNLMNRLDDVLLPFREGRLAVTGDIEAMYHMTYVYEQDRNMLRFLWSNGLNDSPEVYRMKVNIFGGVWSGAAAIFCLQECGKEAESESVRKSIMNSVYVDDWLQSAESEDEVQELVIGVRSCL